MKISFCSINLFFHEKSIMRDISSSCLLNIIWWDILKEERSRKVPRTASTLLLCSQYLVLSCQYRIDGLSMADAPFCFPVTLPASLLAPGSERVKQPVVCILLIAPRERSRGFLLSQCWTSRLNFLWNRLHLPFPPPAMPLRSGSWPRMDGIRAGGGWCLRSVSRVRAGWCSLC